MEDYRKRQLKLAEHMEDNSMMFLFCGTPKVRTNDLDYPFTPNRNFYYMTGLDVKNQIFCIIKLCGKVKTILFVDRPDPFIESYHGPMPTDAQYKEKTGMDEVHYLDRFDKVIWRVMYGFGAPADFDYLYMDYQNRDLNATDTEQLRLTKKLLSSNPHLKSKNIARTIHNMRRIKSPYEIEMIREATRITALGIDKIIENTRPGIYENEIQAHFEFALSTNGANGHAFNPIIAANENSRFLHYEENDKELRAGELLLVDLGAEYKYYASDISRTFPIDGKFTELHKKYYEVVLYAQQAVEDSIKPGADLNATGELAFNKLKEKVTELGLLDDLKDEDETYLYSRGVCHYVGLDTHDVGDRNILEPGMVITNEPGIYIEKHGFGIRLEDVLLVTEDGCENLSRGIPKTVEEIEKLFNKERN